MELYAHQKEGKEAFFKNQGRLALYHEQGLGKTRTAIAIFNKLRLKEKDLKMFVVCTLSLIESVWKEESNNLTSCLFLPFKRIKKYLPNITAINYESLISRKTFNKVLSYCEDKKIFLVVDESSKMKDHRSLITKTLVDLSLKDFVKYKLLLSGNPTPNSPTEFYDQMKFLDKDIFCDSFQKFKNTYFYQEANRFFLKGKPSYIKSYTTKGKEEKALEFKEKINSLSHWRLKKECLDLPEKITQVRPVILSNSEKHCYIQMANDLVTEIFEEKIAAPMALSKLMKLRQITSGFMYSERKKVYRLEKRSKSAELKLLLEEIGDVPVIIFANFKEEIVMIKEICEARGKTVTLYSGTEDREESIKAFKENEARYLIANPQSAAHGLTFTNCSTMIFFSLDFSYENHAQAQDRIHRIGQDKKCLYIYLTALNTFDCDLFEAIQNKEAAKNLLLNFLKKSHKF